MGSGGDFVIDRRAAAALALASLLAGVRAAAQVAPAAAPPPPPPARPAPPVPGAPAPGPGAAVEDGLVQLDFNDVELSVVIDTIARLTGRNFIYDDRVRGRVTIVSPTKIPIAQAYAVFESVLQVKGFTTVQGPGGTVKIIPVRDAKESPVETFSGGRPGPGTDAFITRLIPLRYIDADAITNSLKPLVSKDAAMVAYSPTNTIILTDSASNIRRILSILESIDVETYKEELAVIKIQHADAATLAQQLGDIYGADVSGAGEGGAGTLRAARARIPTPTAVPGQIVPPGGGEVRRDRVRLITDSRTNSLIVLASRTRLEDIRKLVAKLDVPVTGGGRIHVYYLKNADAEDLANTLNSMISGTSSAGATAGARGGTVPVAGVPGPQAQAMRAVVTELAEGVTVTADKGTNSLVIQASQEGFNTLSQVIEQLDIRRPQVLVEALILEVNVNNSEDLGFNGLGRVVNGATDITVASVTDSASSGGLTGAGGIPAASLTPQGALAGLLANAVRNTLKTDANGKVVGGSLIQGIIKATAQDGNSNILSAPHILTSDNEKAEIKIGSNIPLPSSRVQSAQGITTPTTPGTTEPSLATSVNIERKDIGITLDVEPQITEGDSLRLKISQEISNVDKALTASSGFDPNQVGVALSNRKVDNVVVVKDGETVVIGGLVSDNETDNVSKVPWLGDIPFIGWLFKTTSRSLTKVNLLVFLTPHIIREPEDLERETIRKREEFRRRTIEGINLSEEQAAAEEARRREAESYGIPYEPLHLANPVRREVKEHEQRYPLQRMKEIEDQQAAKREDARAAAEAAKHGPRYAILAAVYRDQKAAAGKLTELLDAGYDGTLVSSESGGSVVYEIRLGPYPDQKTAEQAADTLRSAYGLAPSVMVQRESP